MVSRTCSSSPSARALLRELSRMGDPDRARILGRFFKTGPGEYGEGDRFLGIPVPRLRAVLARHTTVSLTAADGLLASRWHEARFLGVIALVRAYARGGPADRKAVFDFYLGRTDRINNWDLVDASAPGIVGRHVAPEKGRGVLGRLVKSPSLWERRIAMVSTLEHIRRGELAGTFWLAGQLMDDPEDLMHKAAGWMLREAGKRDEEALEAFLARHAGRMPRTMLRYAIERLPEARRRVWRTVSRMTPEGMKAIAAPALPLPKGDEDI